MKKLMIAVAVLVGLGLGFAHAEGVDFDGKAMGAMSIMEAIKVVYIAQVERDMKPFSEKAGKQVIKSDIIMQQDEQDKLYKLNSSDRKKLQAIAKVTIKDNDVIGMVNNDELAVLFNYREVVFRDFSGDVKILAEKPNQQTLYIVRSIVYKPVNSLHNKADMDNKWMQPRCIRWGTQEVCHLKTVCHFVNHYVNGGWVGDTICAEIPDCVNVRVCEEYASGI